MALNTKRRVFVEEYLRCWNATEAARRAGYAYPRRQGHRLLTNVDIQARVKERIQEKAMSADEVLLRLAEQAKGDMADFVNIEVRGGILDFQKAKNLGLTHLIKSVSWSKSGVRIELYDAQSALSLLGKHHGLFKDRIEHSGPEGGAVVIKFTGGMRDDDV